MVKRRQVTKKGRQFRKSPFVEVAKSSHKEFINKKQICQGKKENILSQRNNSNDICLFCGEMCHNKELQYCCVICSGWVLAGCSLAECAVTCM